VRAKLRHAEYYIIYIMRTCMVRGIGRRNQAADHPKALPHPVDGQLAVDHSGLLRFASVGVEPRIGVTRTRQTSRPGVTG
jgi:hypothetical protein